MSIGICTAFGCLVLAATACTSEEPDQQSTYAASDTSRANLGISHWSVAAYGDSSLAITGLDDQMPVWTLTLDSSDGTAIMSLPAQTTFANGAPDEATLQVVAAARADARLFARQRIGKGAEVSYKNVTICESECNNTLADNMIGCDDEFICGVKAAWQWEMCLMRCFVWPI